MMRRRFAAQGCTFTFLCWLVAAFLSLGYMMGDCFPDATHECPTDHQRDLAILKIVLGATAVNIGGLFLMGYKAANDRKD
jgi:hypothetical protein